MIYVVGIVRGGFSGWQMVVGVRIWSSLIWIALAVFLVGWFGPVR
jgi:hypothetical protein